MNDIPAIPDELLSAIDEVQQPRSRFQIEHFVLGQHDTIEMGYFQLCLELKDMITSVRLKEMEIRKQRIQIDRLRATNDEIDAIDAEMAEYALQSSEAIYNGTLRELAILVDIWEQFPKRYTREEIEDAQPLYWRLRLERQAQMQAIGEGRVNHAQIDAMRQAGILVDWMRNKEQTQEIEAKLFELRSVEDA